MLKTTLQKANALNDEREELEKKIKAFELWVQSMKEGRSNAPSYRTYFNTANAYTDVEVDKVRFTLLVQVERAECQARLAQVMEEFTALQDEKISEVEFEEGGDHE